MTEEPAETELKTVNPAIGGMDRLTWLTRKADVSDLGVVQTAERPRRAVLRGLPDLRLAPMVARRTALAAPDAVALAAASAKVYAFSTMDYPGAAVSLAFDGDDTTAVGAFVLDPGSSTSPVTAFTLSGGV